jgi:galactitol-specific phosphotransferase system IIB component
MSTSAEYLDDIYSDCGHGMGTSLIFNTYAEGNSDSILNKNSSTNTEVISTLAHEENLTQEMQL